MPHAICSSSEMKHGTSRSRAMRGHRPHHRVRAAAHHAHARRRGGRSRRASGTRVTRRLVPTRAVLGGEWSYSRRAHLVEEHEVGGAAGAVEQHLEAPGGARRLGVPEERRQPDAAGDEE